MAGSLLASEHAFSDVPRTSYTQPSPNIVGAAAIDKLLAEAQKAIEIDGARVIVLGSTAMWQAHDYLQDHLSVPVINPGVWSFKIAELLVRMGKSHSKHDYATPVHPVDDRVFASLAEASQHR